MPDWNSLATPHTLQLEDFIFSNGDKCHIKLHCRTLGALNRAKDNAVLLLHGTTGSSVQFLQPGMADPLFDNGQPLDYSKYFLIAPDAIGHGDSSKPSTTGGTSFPQYSYTDIVKAQHRIVQDLFGL
jgi:homoserine O-acetyltransferase/O-succinyltransferase